MNRSALTVISLVVLVAIATIGYTLIANQNLSFPIDEEPPQIESLTWEPTRVINDKVYNASISFTATDMDSIIANVTVRFIPKNYSHLSSNAFPNDTMREYIVQPVDCIFDEKSEEFLVNVMNITGGREYEINVFTSDNEGNNASASLTTPYIREFENLGKLLYEKGLVIGVTYFEYYPDPVSWSVVSPRIS